jgi:hypothetical protein
MKDHNVSGRTTDGLETPKDRDGVRMDRCSSDLNKPDEPDILSTDPLVECLRRMPQLEPPGSLAPAVMRGIRSIRLPWWRRALRWARTPRSVTVVPLRLLPAAAALMILAIVAVHWLPQDRSQELVARDAANSPPVAFSLQLSGAHSVAVIGSFNEWHPNGYEMHRNDQFQTWSIQLRLPPGRYEYAFLVDGQEIIADPQAPFYQDDGFGNQNGVLIVGNHHETRI